MMNDPFSINLESPISEKDVKEIERLIQLAFDLGIKKGLEERIRNVK